LRKIGFSSLNYSETLLTIRFNNVDYTIPFGVLYRKGLLYGRIYHGSRMYDYLKSNVSHATICVTSNPLLFYYAVFDKSRLKYTYRSVSGLDYPLINGCDAYIYCTVYKRIVRRDRVNVWFKPVEVEVEHRYPRVFNRGLYAIVEALVYYTKLEYVSNSDRLKYVKYIEQCRESVYRSCKSKRLRRVIDHIYKSTLEKLKGF